MHFSYVVLYQLCKPEIHFFQIKSLKCSSISGGRTHWTTLACSLCSLFSPFFLFLPLSNNSHGLGRTNLLSFRIEENPLGFFVVLKLVLVTNDLMGIGACGFICCICWHTNRIYLTN